eukprot:TRINITY_DN100_c0_g1_i4.p1 TRINITY_DN100_c0_g1~~TRINITY_DN100_c0_g1_i4.p1  ORF type:complete len:700 (-),score=239.83 TRINITY_DN100_c0_g1_i4:43-2142(-)
MVRATLALLAPVALASGNALEGTASTEVEVQANPIRKVVNMLQKMYDKIEGEGEKEKELYDAFMCHCKSELDAFGAGKAKFEAAVPRLQAQVDQTKADLEKYSGEIDKLRLERGDSKASIEAAKVKREQGKDVFEKQNAEFEANIAAMNAAIPVLEKATGFLQTKTMALASLSQDHLDRVQQAVMNSNVASEADKRLFSAFLAIGTDEEDAENSPDSSSVKVLIEKTRDEEAKAEKELEDGEEEEVNIFLKLLNAKNTEIETLENSISMKIDKVGELKVELIELKGQLSDAQKALGKDFALVEQLAETCKAKTADWELRSKTRAEELLAVQETIKILNSDSALETFKKNLPSSPSLLQLGSGAHEQARKQVLSLMNQISNHGKSVSKNSKFAADAILLAISSKGADYSKVMKMIDEMVVLLRKEQKDEDKKKGYCEETFFENQKNIKVLERKVKGFDEVVKAKTDAMATLAEDIKALTAGIKELDTSVTDATGQRQKEHEEYSEAVVGNGQAQELLRMAKKRMNQFYHPDVATLDKINVTTPPPAFYQVSVKVHDHHAAPPPETYGNFKTSEGAGNTIIHMLDGIIKEIDAENAEAKHEENTAQKNYEKFLADAKEKREADSQAVVDKEKAKAEAETQKINHATGARDTQKELSDVQMYDMEVHTDCDWMLKHYVERKEGRTTEQEGLVQAKEVLAGAA